MNQEAPQKKNPALNLGVITMSIGTLIAVFAERDNMIGNVFIVIGAVMFFIGIRQQKGVSAPKAPANERRKRLRLIMICLAISFFVSPLLLRPSIARLNGVGLWVFIIGDVVSFIGVFCFLAYQYKKAGNDSMTEI